MSVQVWMTATGELFVVYGDISIMFGEAGTDWCYSVDFLGCELLGEL